MSYTRQNFPRQYNGKNNAQHNTTCCYAPRLQHLPAISNFFSDALGCRVVGFRTDNFNFTSQRAIGARGAQKDGVIRHHQARRDGTIRDTVMFSILAAEWPDVQRHLATRLARYSTKMLGTG